MSYANPMHFDHVHPFTCPPKYTRSTTLPISLNFMFTIFDNPSSPISAVHINICV